MGWLHWDNFSFIIIPLIKSNDSMECPFSVHSYLELLMSSGSRCNFLFRTEARPRVLTPPSSNVYQLWHSLLSPKGQLSTLPLLRLLLPKHPLGEGEWDGQEGREGNARGVLSVLPDPADHLPQVKHIFKCSTLTQLPLKNIQQLLCKHSGENLPGNSDLSAGTLP